MPTSMLPFSYRLAHAVTFTWPTSMLVHSKFCATHPLFSWQAGGELLKAAEVCAQLASQDTIRERYWHWRKARALAASSAATATAPPQEVS